MGMVPDAGPGMGGREMNIREALEEIVRTVRAYTSKDEAGCYRIPTVSQRPVLLMGPPGIGKTAIMEQAAEECGVGLVAYTITHHTRQSAVGLPELVRREFDGKTYTMTEYTMSEIIGSIYEYRERTGLREGILFIDEINCVSETLAPTMLQFLQFKTFGTHRVPEGWIIAAAGNPPEFNRSVRELDMAALDRVRILEVEADYHVWRDYVLARDIHPAVLAYLDIHPEHFYQVIQTRDKKEFVTARGWADLSILMKEYERLKMPLGRDFMGEFLRSPKIASDFVSYYQVYTACAGAYRIPELADGKLSDQETKKLQTKLRSAPSDMRCMFVRHLLSAAFGRLTDWGGRKRLLDRELEVLKQLWAHVEQGKSPEAFLENRSHAFQVKKENDLLKPAEERLERSVDHRLRIFLHSENGLRFAEVKSSDELLELAGMNERREELELGRQTLYGCLDRMTDFLRDTFGEDLELTDWLHGLKSHGDFKICGYDREEFRLSGSQREQEERLKKQIKEMERLYETDDCI